MGNPGLSNINLAAIGLIALSIAATTLSGQFHGEDELITMLVVEEVVDGIRRQDIGLVLKAIGADWQPPGRNLLPVPFVALFGADLWVIRLPNVIGWALVAVLAAKLGDRMGGKGCGWLSGLLVATSGLFNVGAMGFGHGMATFWGMALLTYLSAHPPTPLTDRRSSIHYSTAALIGACGFIWFATLATMVGALHLVYLYHCLRNPDRWETVRRYVIWSLPFGIFYVGYYAVFIGVPLYMVTTGLVDQPFGQLAHYMARSTLNVVNVGGFSQSISQNIAAANWYFLPFIGPALGFFGVWALVRLNGTLFIVTIPYFVLVNFIMTPNTGQHYLSFIAWTIPFSVAWLSARLGKPRLRMAAAAALLLSTAGWSAYIHVQRFTEASYPSDLKTAVNGWMQWPNNLIRPIDDIVADLKAVTPPDALLHATVDGVFSLFYHREGNWTSSVVYERAKDGSCISRITDKESGIPVRAVVLDVRFTTICAKSTETVHRYPESYLAVVVLKLPE